MPTERRLAQLIEVQAALSRALAHGDQGHAHVAPLPHGYTALGSPREELRDPPEAARLAFVRALYWQAYLRRLPSRGSVLRLSFRFRAYALWRAALARHIAHAPLPLAAHWTSRHGQHVPAFALRPPLPRGATLPAPAATAKPRLARPSMPVATRAIPTLRAASDTPPDEPTPLTAQQLKTIWEAMLADPGEFWYTWDELERVNAANGTATDAADAAGDTADALSQDEVDALLSELDADPLMFLLRYSGTPEETIAALAQYLGVHDATGFGQSLLDTVQQLGDNAAAGNDALDFWQDNGAADEITAEEWQAALETPQAQPPADPNAPTLPPPATPSLSGALLPAELTSAAALLSFERNLLAAGRLLSDSQVLQLINTSWASQALQLGADGLMADLGAEAAIISSWNIVNPAALDYLRQQSGLLIEGIDSRTQQVLAEALWQGYRGLDQQALNMEGLARYLQGVLRDSPLWDTIVTDAKGVLSFEVSRARALLIARTETARALSFGEMVVAAKWGLRFKRWIANAGACLICLGNVDAGVIPLDAAFPGLYLAPPQHPLCRCSVQPCLANGDDAFDPENWANPAGTSDYDGMLFDPAYGNFPNVQWPISSAQADAPPPAATADLGLLDYDTLPPDTQALLTPDVLNQIGALLGGRADAAAQAWADGAGVEIPSSDAGLAGTDLGGVSQADLDALWADLGDAADGMDGSDDGGE